MKVNTIFYLAMIGLILMMWLLSSCAVLQYQNPHASLLRWNYLEKNWSYAPADAQLKFNYYEKRWEFSK